VQCAQVALQVCKSNRDVLETIQDLYRCERPSHKIKSYR
jgi:hypothetical protein